jgi:uridine phosphorylase
MSKTELPGKYTMQDLITPEGYMGMLWDVGLRIKLGENLGKYALIWRDEFGTKGELAAEYLKDARIVSDFRGNTTWTGLYDGIRVAVAATNWGSGAASVAVEELANLGVETFIRFGTCGSLQDWLKLNELVIGEGCVRADGASLEYMPPEYPAVCNLEVTRALVDAAEKLGEKYYLGLTRTHDAYFVETNEGMGDPSGPAGPRAYSHTDRRLSRISVFSRAGVLAVENEAAATILPARLRGLKCGAFFCVTGNMITNEEVIPKDCISRVKSLLKIGFEAIKVMENRG